MYLYYMLHIDANWMIDICYIGFNALFMIYIIDVIYMIYIIYYNICYLQYVCAIHVHKHL